MSTAGVADPFGWFEDFEVGRRMRHARRSTIGEVEGSFLAKQVMNTAQPHFNDDFLRDGPLGGGRLVFGLATAATVYGLVSQDTAAHAVAELGWDGMRFLAPVHHGDTLEAFTEVLAATDGDTPGAGVVSFRHWGRRQDGVVVFTATRTTLVSHRPEELHP